MLWWSWLIIALLGIATLASSIWYFLSVSQLSNKSKTINWPSFIASQQPLSAANCQQLKNWHGILLVVVGAVDSTDKTWQPLYLVKSNDIPVTINELNTEIKAHYQLSKKHFISDYLRRTQQSPSAVEYYLFRRYRTEVSLNRDFSKWLIKSQLKQIGFNQFDNIFI